MNCPQQLVVSDKEKIKKRFWSIKLIIMLICIFILLGTAVFGYFFVSKKLEYFNSLGDLKITQQALTTEVNNLKAQLTNQQQLITQQQSDILNINKFIVFDDARLKLIKSKYLIAEAIMLAKLGENKENIVHYLAVALKNLSGIAGDKTKNIQNDLNASIKYFSNLDLVAKSSTYQTLEKINAQLLLMPLVPDKFSPKENGQAQPQDAKSSFVDKFLAKVKELFVITKHDKAVSSFLTEAQRQDLFLLININFAQAKWALLQNQPVVYRAAINNIQELIKTYWVLNKTDVINNIIVQLDVIKSKTIELDLQLLENAQEQIDLVLRS